MKLLSQLLRFGYIFVLIKLINGYLLIAANLNDFRAIAKKLIPEDLADKIKKVISEQGAAKVSETSYETTYYEDNDNLSDNNNPNLKVNTLKKPKDSVDFQGSKVDFDELVERVKKRLEEELKYKFEKKHKDQKTKAVVKKEEYAVITHNKSNKITSSNYNKIKSLQPEIVEEDETYESIDYEEAVPVKPKYVQKVLKFTTKDDGYEYVYAMAESEAEKEKQVVNKEKKTKDKIYYDYERVTQNDVYKKIDMVKKDSYEDYKIPEKENIYSSSEKNNNKRFKIQQRPPTTRKIESVHNKYNERVIKSEEIAAVTEDLVYDYNDTEIITDRYKMDENIKAVDKRIGTVIPKRQLYTISTPNYIDKIPNVVEKYNFDEPIPERDQERQALKYYGNPPARINRKVRL